MNKKFLVIAIIVGALLGFLAGMLNIQLSDFGLSFEGLLITLVSFVVLMVLHIALHEAGHLIAGLMSGYKFVSYRLMNLMWMKHEDGTIRLHKFSLAGTGGQCLMSPPGDMDDVYPVIFYNLGGPLMNLLLALVAFLVLRMTSSQAIKNIAVDGIFIGLVFAFMNGVPARSMGINNDGLNALELTRSPGARKAFWVQLHVCEAQSFGKRLKDMPEEWFAPDPADDLTNSLVASRMVFRENLLMDRHHFDEAEALAGDLMDSEAGVPGIYQGLLKCDMITTSLLSGKDCDNLADDGLTKILKSMNTLPQVVRTSYAIALLKDRDTQKAAACKRAFEALASTYPYASDLASEREIIALIDERNRVCENQSD